MGCTPPTPSSFGVTLDGTESQDSALAPSDKFPWRFVDANAFVASGAIRIVSFDDISGLDFVAISYVWTDGIKKWRNCISSPCGSTYEETIERGSRMLSISTEPADISDGDGIAHAHLFLNIVAFFVLTRGKKFFWIDILCINQDEQREKSFYVPHMGDLYRRAAETHAYPFGAKIPPSLFSDEVYFPIWETRAWTVQEQILSKRVLFCYAFQGDVRQDLRNLRSNAGRSDPERLVDMHTPVLDRYRYADGIFLLETKGNIITCKMEEESWNTLPTDAWISGADGSALIRREQSDMYRGLVRGSAYKVLSVTKESQVSNTAEAARISILRIAMERRSTIPEDMIYSMLGVFDLGNFRVGYKIGLEEARLRVFEALSPKILAHIIGTNWNSKSSANNKDSALPIVVGSSPVSCIISLESAIRHCKYTRNVGTWMNCRREKFRVWSPDTRVRLDKGFLRATLGNDQLLPMHIASIFDTPEVASMPTKMIPRDLTKVIIVEMSAFGVNSDDEASKIDRTAEFVEIGGCDAGAMVVPSLPEIMGKSSLLALYCEDTASGALVNRGTVLIMDASAFSTDYGDTLIA
ncbi:hypothetical protein HD554DRAFT_2174841 [Boletus coccyginus]|nr:hypothetical protein HD554DRAFT_2174841 [Boletus coccyginus]